MIPNGKGISKNSCRNIDSDNKDLKDLIDYEVDDETDEYDDDSSSDENEQSSFLANNSTRQRRLRPNSAHRNWGNKATGNFRELPAILEEPSLSQLFTSDDSEEIQSDDDSLV